MNICTLFQWKQFRIILIKWEAYEFWKLCHAISSDKILNYFHNIDLYEMHRMSSFNFDTELCSKSIQ